MSDNHHHSDGESDPQHGITVVFLLVLVFFIMGLVGFLICHVLKKKGYRCRTFRDELDPDDKDGVEELQDGECWGGGGSLGARPCAWCGLVLLIHPSGTWDGAGRVTCHVWLPWEKGLGGESSAVFPGDRECEGQGSL
ncbi:hypothetical protein DV515_00015113 [Chloebia gouldiae]|uniref:RELT-like protein 2 n=1 Tax=Chloebia gouldiae TaxID=44316 RepID=A0A3L8RWI8_CHLGU|nr:hypothetical protein DV515_00015113 [Chloebia gouldiae]